MSNKPNVKSSNSEDSVDHPMHTKSRPITISTKYKEDPKRQMKAAQWFGGEDIRVNTIPAPDITDAGDAIVRITTCTICGSDLHMYFNQLPAPRGVGMQKGDVMVMNQWASWIKLDRMSKTSKWDNGSSYPHPLHVVNVSIAMMNGILYVIPLIHPPVWKLSTVIVLLVSLVILI